MINWIIAWSLKNRVLVLLSALFITLSGVYIIKNTPVDAIPDLSDVQVIVKTSYAGQSPQVIEDQITYPLTSAMLSVPKAKTVRGFSFFGDSYVYIIFDEGTDLYWARSRVLEYLNQASASLPEQAVSSLGPDATGVGWVYMYALQDKSNQHDLSELTSLQDFFLKYQLQAVPGVSEVATAGGIKKQYDVVLKPERLRQLAVPIEHVISAIKNANQAIGASVVERAEAEYMVNVSGYIESIEDIKSIPLRVNENAKALLLGDVANVRLGPQKRRGVTELNGEGEAVGGIVVMRYGENAQQTISKVKQKLDSLRSSLPDGVEIVTVYDRSKLISSAVNHLSDKLIEELIIVTLVCAVFLFHLRSSLVAVITLPLGIFIAFAAMKALNVNANIMSLGGIAIAIGAMTDGAIVMIENMHKHMEKQTLNAQNRWQIVKQSAQEVGPALFFSLLIITVSFLPIFMLEAQEGKMFTPLAYTKTFAMAGAALLAITLTPVLMGYLIRGKVVSEQKNPLNRLLIYIYRPVLAKVLNWPKLTLTLAALLVVGSIYPLKQLGSEFMPTLDEGDLMYMPTTYPSISVAEARQLLQQTNKLIASIPEVNNVFGKVGRAETATDPAPLTMIETFIELKDKRQWRKGLTLDDLKSELDSLMKIPGLTNAWVMPIKTRIEMLSTGVKTPLGIKVSGAKLSEIEAIGSQIEAILNAQKDTASAYFERVGQGRYINVDIDRQKAARFGLNIGEIHNIIMASVGGNRVTTILEGNERYQLSVRYPQAQRDSVFDLKRLAFVTTNGHSLILSDVADIEIAQGPAAIKSENAQKSSWLYIDVAQQVDLGQYVENMQHVLDENLTLPSGYTATWVGQYQSYERAKEKLMVVVPLTVFIVIVLLYINFRSFTDVLMIIISLPLALTGGLWLLYLMEFKLSVAVGVGFIALAGVAVEIGVIMLVYLNQARAHHLKDNHKTSLQQWHQVITQGAGLRVRPVIMTVATIILGLLPVLYGTGTGSELMSRVAAPMVGGMLSATLLCLLVLPALYALVKKPR